MPTAQTLTGKVISTAQLLCALCIIAPFALAQSSNKPLTNADVVRMTKSGLGPSVIIKMIESSDTKFDTSVDAVIKLHSDGVGDKIIEVMQEAEARKTRPNTQDGGPPAPTKPTGPYQTPRPLPPPAPTPMAAPTPVAVQDAQFFTFELKRCSISGTSAACFFTITNNSQDRRLSLSTGSSSLIDTSGNEARGRSARIANEESYYPSVNIPEGVSVESWVRFEGVQSSASTIARLSIRFYPRPGSQFDLQFRNIPLERSTKSNKTVGNTSSGLPETDRERRDRERREQEAQRKQKQFIDNLLRSVRRRRY